MTSSLSARERLILELLGRGLRNREIAALCGTSHHTVRNQLSRLFVKLDVSTRTELVARAIADGLLSAFE